MIRKATTEDTSAIAKLIIVAMGDLANKFRGSDNKNEVLALFEYFIKLKGNQYSLENILVHVINKNVVGAINAYDGGKIEELRKPFLAFINKNYHKDSFKVESETEAGEFYIDTLSVNQSYQGKGIGKELLTAGIDWAKKLGHHKVGLLVDFGNPDAKRLYKKVGFIEADVKILLDKKYDHLVYQM